MKTPEAVLLIGIQASGKSGFTAERFAISHEVLNLDTLRTRAREARLLADILERRASFIVDNTNVSRLERRRYIPAARAAGYRVVGYVFEAAIGPALARNAARERVVPEAAIRATRNRLEWPVLEEGFDELHFVRIENGGFIVEAWGHEV